MSLSVRLARIRLLPVLRAVKTDSWIPTALALEVSIKTKKEKPAKNAIIPAIPATNPKDAWLATRINTGFTTNRLGSVHAEMAM